MSCVFVQIDGIVPPTVGLHFIAMGSEEAATLFPWQTLHTESHNRLQAVT